MAILPLLKGSKQLDDLILSAFDGMLIIENIAYPDQMVKIPLEKMYRGKIVFLHPVPRETDEGPVETGNISVRCAPHKDIVTITWFKLPIYGTVTWHVALQELNKALEEKMARVSEPLLNDRQIDEGFE